ncbi:MAG: C40 family peptidase [Treponema sp.]|jgi:probable lipoprotein NlpC|nr:C40 family peptidase [Treponema sp.]
MRFPLNLIKITAVFIFSALVFPALYAAPLEYGYSLAPGAAYSDTERAFVFSNIRQRIVNAAVHYIGVPYQYGGSSLSGLDCSGLLCLTFMDAIGVTVPRSASDLFTWSERVEIEDAQSGDLLFFRTGTGANINHVALYLGNGRFIHSASSGPQTGVIYSTLDEPYYNGCFAGAGKAFP